MVLKRSALVSLMVLGGIAPDLMAQGGPPFRLDQVERLLRAEVHGIIEDLSRDCIAFDLGESNVTRLQAAGADAAFIEALRNVCQRIPQPALNSTSACNVRALLDVVDVRAERREFDLAFITLERARTQVQALTTIYPGEPAWPAFGQEIAAKWTSVFQSCDVWRQVRLERGLPAPDCRELPQREGEP